MMGVNGKHQCLHHGQLFKETLTGDVDDIVNPKHPPLTDYPVADGTSQALNMETEETGQWQKKYSIRTPYFGKH